MSTNENKGEALVAFERAATLETSKFYMGNIMSFLVRGEESDGKVAMMEYRSKPG